MFFPNLYGVLWCSVNFWPKETNNFHSRRHTQLPYLLAGVCHLGTNQRPSYLCFVFVNSWREEEDTLLMAVLMSLMCNSGQQNLPKHNIFNYYQSCVRSPALMMSHCQTHHPQLHWLLLKYLNVTSTQIPATYISVLDYKRFRNAVVVCLRSVPAVISKANRV